MLKNEKKHWTNEEKNREKQKTEHLFDHEAKKLVFEMQVHELDYVFDSPHLRNAFVFNPQIESC